MNSSTFPLPQKNPKKVSQAMLVCDAAGRWDLSLERSRGASNPPICFFFLLVLGGGTTLESFHFC